MAKWCGKVCYIWTNETSPGVWTEEKVERKYYGDVTRNMRRLQSSDKVNDDINVSNEISIVADPFAYQNFHYIRYVEFMGTKWKVPTAEVKYPRIYLTLGGVYNE